MEEENDDVISGRNINTVLVVDFEGATFSSFRDFPKTSLCDGEVCDGSGGMNAICSRPEVADVVISGKDVDAFWYYPCVNVWVTIFSGFRENLNQQFMSCVDVGWSSRAPHFQSQ